MVPKVHGALGEQKAHLALDLKNGGQHAGRQKPLRRSQRALVQGQAGLQVIDGQGHKDFLSRRAKPDNRSVNREEEFDKGEWEI